MIGSSSEVAKLSANYDGRSLIFIGYDDPYGAVRWCMKWVWRAMDTTDGHVDELLWIF